MAANAPKNVAIIGSGVAGLASAIRLAARGHKVCVFEAAACAGGKVGEHRDGPYRFDLGPSLFTLPEALDELFRDAGADPAAYYGYRKLDTICRYFFADGKVLNAWADPEQMAREFEEVLGEPAENIHRYLAQARRLYDLTEPIFLRSSLHDWRTYWRAPWLKTLAGLPHLGAFQTMHRANEQMFNKPNSVQLFNRYATYNGSSPYKAPATLNVIGHLEHNMGAYFLQGGMRSLVTALHQLALERGVQFRFETPVEKILTRRQRFGRHLAVGVRAGGADHPADVVVSNMDVVPTYRQLLPELRHPSRILNQPRSTAALIFYWGMDRQYPALDVHNILFSADYPAEFRHLTETKTLCPDPTVYLYISSKAEPDDAPAGGENWFAMINVPHLAGQDWDTIVRDARTAILRKVERVLGEPVAPHIRSEFHLDPRDIQARTSSHLGALYGNSSDNRFAAFLRHPNFSRKLPGLYFCGGSVHPGGGIPLCLLSAHIVDEQVLRRQQSRAF
ncbi:MAG: phytoene desaturase [Bacteroidetes bacterium]|nr:phytoene desaturase [Bacteroidota bacterium]